MRIVYDIKNFDSIHRGDIIYIYEWAMAEEYELDTHREDPRVKVLTDIMLITKDGKSNSGLLTGWYKPTAEYVDPTDEEVKEITAEVFGDFFSESEPFDYTTLEPTKYTWFLQIEIAETLDRELKKCIIKSIKDK